ncbi:MAG: ABC transporter permease [Pseudolysinimonas sp.]
MSKLPALPRQRGRRQTGFWVAVVTIAIFALLAIFGPLITPYPPNQLNLVNAYASFSLHNPFGTDSLGRDTLSRLMVGTRSTIIAPLVIVILAGVVGSLAGLVMGWRSGWADWTLSRSADILLAFPALLMAILAVALFGKGIIGPVVGMSIAYTPVLARFVRGLVVAERHRTYVAAYLVQGMGPARVAVTKLLPNVVPLIMGQLVLIFGYALLDMTALSFLGFGVQPPDADWGSMVGQGRDAILTGTPEAALVPAVAIVIVVTAVNLVGTWFADRSRGVSR